MSKRNTQARNALPARQFAIPAQRQEPLENASPVRNAVARFDPVQGLSDGERDAAWPHTAAAATLQGVAVHEPDWRAAIAARSRRGAPPSTGL